MIELRPRAEVPVRDPDKRFTIKRRDWFADCRHHLTEIDETLRRVTCRTCKEVLDPIEVLLMFARADKSLDNRVELIKEFEAREERKRQKARERREKRRG